MTFSLPIEKKIGTTAQHSPESISNPLGVSVHKLRCEGLINPLQIEQDQPVLSWKLYSQGLGKKQSAYQITAASSEEYLYEGRYNLWDSGKVISRETFGVPYLGKIPEPGRRCWWRVRVWDELDQESSWSPSALFGRGVDLSNSRVSWVGFNATRSLSPSPAPFDGAKWIWKKTLESAGEAGVLVGTLLLPDDVQIQDSLVAIAASGKFEFYWRGEKFGMSDGRNESWRKPYIRHMNERLHPGANHFLIRVEPKDGVRPAVLFKATVWTQDGREYCLRSDQSWRAVPAGNREWRLPESPKQIIEAAVSLDGWAEEIFEYENSPFGLLSGSMTELPPASYLRKEFVVRDKVRFATMFATSLGWFDAALNGRRVNSTYFDPGWTDYAQRLHYRGFDVTGLIQEGTNAWTATLADGWFSGHIGWCGQRDLYGRDPRFRALIQIEYEDGEIERIHTDPTWKASLGPIREADILMGESYDATLEMPGWDLPGFDDRGWASVDLGSELKPPILPHQAEGVIALESEAHVPRTISSPLPGVYIFDLGQNFSGVVRLRVRDAKRGQKIVIRHGERLCADGTLYTRNLRTARATDVYVCRGDAEETWTPRFTFHGFQFVEIQGLTTAPDLSTVTGIPLSSGTEIVAIFETSDGMVNRLARNIYWSQRSNFIEVPTDCPQRDERLGWLDCTCSYIRAAAYWADVHQFFRKYNADLRDAQLEDGQFPWVAPNVVARVEHAGPMWADSSPAWMDAGVFAPWAIYEIYGDLTQLAESFPSMARLIDYYHRTSVDFLPPAEFKCLGDWLNEGGHIPLDVFRAAFFARSARLVAQSAGLLRRTEEERHYRSIWENVRSAFIRSYVSAEGVIKGDVQGCYALALDFDLLDGSLEELAQTRLAAKLAEDGWKLTTGLEATLPLMRALSGMGRSDFAYRLLQNEDYPSWNYSINNGATTIWERWDSWTPERGFGDANMNSFNHFSLGAVFQWMMETIGGIRSLEPGFGRILIAPEPGGTLRHADVTYDSVRGPIRCAWSIENGALEIVVTIPVNTSALFRFPSKIGDGLAPVTRELTSGTHRFRVEDWESPRDSAS